MAQTCARLDSDRAEAASGRPESASTANRVRRLLGSGAMALLLSGCGTVVFQSNFNSNAIGAPPSPNQLVGTIQVGGDPSSVIVVAPPPGASGNWVQIQRSQQQQSVSTMLCTFAPQSYGPGSYSLLVALFIPSSTSGLATVTFQTGSLAQPPNQDFLHLDFMPDNKVRINDDGSTEFGTFPRDHLFTLAVTLDVTSSTATAHIGLLGAGASGTKDYDVTPLFLAQQLGAVMVWMGWPWNGSFDATDILVTKH
jgi:hypothetical protein